MRREPAHTEGRPHPNPLALTEFTKSPLADEWPFDSDWDEYRLNRYDCTDTRDETQDHVSYQ